MCLCVFFKIKLLRYNELRETHGFFTSVRAVLLDIRVVFWYNTVYMIGGELWRRLGDRRRKNRILIR